MSNNGVFAVARKVFDHEFFAAEPFTEREAWIWLIGEAQWKARRARVGRTIISLERGQCAFSTRFLAAKWGWSEARVRRFLNRLKSDAMVEIETDALATRITICKYNDYQRVSLPSDAQSDAETDALATHSRRKEEGREYTSTNVLSAEGAPEDIRKALFSHGLASLRRQTGKAERASRSLLAKWLKQAYDDAAYVLTTIRQAEADQVADPVAWIEACLLSRFDRKKPRAKTERDWFARP